MQQGDVFIFQTVDGGEVNIEDGLVQMSGGLSTAAYLSLFGGNEDDDGSKTDKTFTWWGNIDESQPEMQYRSETQHLVNTLFATTGNLRRIEDAAKRDLAWFVSGGVASFVDAVASLPSIGRLDLAVRIEARGEEYEFTFVANWRASP